MMRSYWKHVLCRAFRDTLSGLHLQAWGQILGALAIAAAVIIVLVFWGSSGAASDELVARAAAIGAIVLAFPLVYSWNLLRIPALRDAELTRTISDLRSQLRKSLRFARDTKLTGDEGFYRASLWVENTSKTEKLLNCRCEIIELADESGEILMQHIGLRTTNQANKENQGRFYLDQGAEKEIPLFDIDQSGMDEERAIAIINAEDEGYFLPAGVYTALVRAYGDRGEADEVRVRLTYWPAGMSILDAPHPAALAWAPLL
jgi:hypothetical protein